jgi:hypothetical protein
MLFGFWGNASAVVFLEGSAAPKPPKPLQIIGFIRLYKIMRNNCQAKSARDNIRSYHIIGSIRKECNLM